MIDKEEFLDILNVVITEIKEIDDHSFKEICVDDTMAFARFDTINNDSFKTFISIKRLA